MIKGKNIQNVSTGQQNEAGYPEFEYGTHKPSAAELIRAQGEQIRRMPAEEYLKDKIGSDADESGEAEQTQEE